MRPACYSGPLTSITPLLLAALPAGCLYDSGTERSGGPVPVSSQQQQMAARVATMTLAVAVADQGGGPFDNYLPCVRRGVVNYHDTGAGRHAIFSGCDLGGGVVMDGSGDIRWMERARSPVASNITGAAFDGALTVTAGVGTPQEAQYAIDRLVTEDMDVVVEWEQDLPARLQLGAMNVTVGGETVRVDDASLPGHIFDTASIDMDTIPNPGGSLSSLSETDTRRLALHGAMVLARLLVNETLESQRGDHVHDESPIGRIEVTYDPVTQLPRIVADWQELANQGLIMSGAFELRWTRFQPDGGALGMEAGGALTVGGGIPRVDIDRITWEMTLPAMLSDRARISGTIEGEGGPLPFDFDYLVDD